MGDRQYSYTFTGKGVTVVTLDTGIYPEHNEFEGKSVTCGKSVISDEKNCIDYRGHGSHVAGLAVGKKVCIDALQFLFMARLQTYQLTFCY